MKVSNALAEVTALLADQTVPESRSEAALLTALAIGKDKTFLIAHPEYELTAAEKNNLNEFARRRANREPFQYISGRQEFFGLDFDLSSDVLIPRPETEILVEKAIEILLGHGASSFCEVGIGSGCIAVSILTNAAGARGVGLDISPKALAVAAANARKHSVADRLRLAESDVFSSIQAEKFDMIVSNPPYVPVSDIRTLQPEVRDFEPVAALSGGDDGLSIVRRIVHESPQFLKLGGYLLIEIGFRQSEKTMQMFDPGIWESPDFLPDLQGIPRIVQARLRMNGLE